MFDLSPALITFLMFAGLLIGLFMGHPLAFILGGLAVIFGLISWGPASFFTFSNRIVGVMDNFILPAIPLFIFMANLLQHSGVLQKVGHEDEQRDGGQDEVIHDPDDTVGKSEKRSRSPADKAEYNRQPPEDEG